MWGGSSTKRLGFAVYLFVDALAAKPFISQICLYTPLSSGSPDLFLCLAVLFARREHPLVEGFLQKAVYLPQEKLLCTGYLTQ